MSIILFFYFTVRLKFFLKKILQQLHSITITLKLFVLSLVLSNAAATWGNHLVTLVLIRSVLVYAYFIYLLFVIQWWGPNLSVKRGDCACYNCDVATHPLRIWWLIINSNWQYKEASREPCPTIDCIYV
jgi:hypothetical protein